jgi:hypothetical protein
MANTSCFVVSIQSILYKQLNRSNCRKDHNDDHQLSTMNNTNIILSTKFSGVIINLQRRCR